VSGYRDEFLEFLSIVDHANLCSQQFVQNPTDRVTDRERDEHDQFGNHYSFCPYGQSMSTADCLRNDFT